MNEREKAVQAVQERESAVAELATRKRETARQLDGVRVAYAESTDPAERARLAGLVAELPGAVARLDAEQKTAQRELQAARDRLRALDKEAVSLAGLVAESSGRVSGIDAQIERIRQKADGQIANLENQRGAMLAEAEAAQERLAMLG